SLHESALGSDRRSNGRRVRRRRREERRADPQHHDRAGETEDPPRDPEEAVRPREAQPHGTSTRGKAGGLPVVREVREHELVSQKVGWSGQRSARPAQAGQEHGKRTCETRRTSTSRLRQRPAARRRTHAQRPLDPRPDRREESATNEPESRPPPPEMATRKLPDVHQLRRDPSSIRRRCRRPGATWDHRSTHGAPSRRTGAGAGDPTTGARPDPGRTNTGAPRPRERDVDDRTFIGGCTTAQHVATRRRTWNGARAGRMRRRSRPRPTDRTARPPKPFPGDQRARVPTGSVSRTPRRFAPPPRRPLPRVTE